jgi:2-dehydropantoate 2-reductase
VSATGAPPVLASRPRVLIVGAGALGSVYGACLARAGLRVTLLAREAHARAVSEQHGLTVTEADGSTWRTRLRAAWRPEQIQDHEVVVLATKSHDSRVALEGIGHLRDGVQLAVSVQNGVEKDRVLADWCGAERVIGGMSMVGATLEAPGCVRWTLAGPTYLGELPCGESERCRRIVQYLCDGGMNATLCPTIQAAEWAKLVHAAPVMSLTAMSRRPLHEVLDSDLARHYVDAVREGMAVAAAAGVEVSDFPGLLPVRSIATAPSAEAAVELVRERGRQLGASGATRVRVSMLVDLERGRPLELGAVHRFLVHEADRLGVAVPTTRRDLATLEQIMETPAS